ncbi:hypothetical protein CANCADRAFT_11892, partial [Tortispora caseinolytica NRRL Y-17796]
PASHAPSLAPGTVVAVGSHHVIIDKYLSQGGYAQVFSVFVNNTANKAVLKRVEVPNKQELAYLKIEVDSMRRLKGHKNIVSYIDSHASHIPSGGYEVFLLMEYCERGGLIDFMNTRLQERLQEPEILRIICHVTEAVAHMHQLSPAIVHRDLKIENVLISSDFRFKVCDFGSASSPIPSPDTAKGFEDLELDIRLHTTPQYRSPEMVDLYKGYAIDERSDIWALGILLYKLCYYTTPFEPGGNSDILNGKLHFPSYPSYSDRLKKLIKQMLSKDPDMRPTAVQVLKDICLFRGIVEPM